MKAKPVYVAICGNVKVKVARNGNAGFVIAWRPSPEMPRVREPFTNKSKAMARADEIAQAIAKGLVDTVLLTGAKRDSFRRAELTAAPLGMPVHMVVEEFAAARALLPEGYTVYRACEETAKRVTRRSTNCPPTAEVVSQYLAHLRGDPHYQRTDEYLSRLEARLGIVANSFPSLAALSVEGLDADERVAREESAKQFLRNLTRRDGEPVSAKTRDHFLGAAKEICGFAQSRGFIPAGAHAFSALDKIYEPGAVETFSLVEMRELLRVVEEQWIPFVAIGAFAGLRVAEIGRMTWDAIRWDESELVLDRKITKTNRPRNVPMEPNLREWLSPLAKKVGPLYRYAAFEKAVSRMHGVWEEAIEGFEWKGNGLRHSYGSYLYGRERDMGLVIANMGTSQQMMHSYYNSPKTIVEGTSYFKIARDPATGIVPLPAAATR